MKLVDRITVLFAGLRVDRAYAQQRLLLDFTTTAYRYGRLSYLDFDALNYSGLWVNYSEFGRALRELASVQPAPARDRGGRVWRMTGKSSLDCARAAPICGGHHAATARRTQ